MPLEVRELIVKVQVGEAAAPAPRALDRAEIATLRRELVAACLAELRQREVARNER